MNVSVYVQLVEQAREIDKDFNLSEFIDQQLEWYVNIHSSEERIECGACGCVFSSKVWIKFTHNKDSCINCSSKILKRTKSEVPILSNEVVTVVAVSMRTNH